MASIVLSAATSVVNSAITQSINSVLPGFGNIIAKPITHTVDGWLRDAITGVPNHNHGLDAHIEDLACRPRPTAK